MKMHPETKHKMEDGDWEDHMDGLEDHMDEYGESMPEHHKTLMKGMQDEMNEYQGCDEEDEKSSEKAPSGLDNEREPKNDGEEEPMHIIISLMNKKHAEHEKKNSLEKK